MARMIPNYCVSESPGERKLFQLLRDDPLTKDWTILHSLHIAHHISKAKGEADFVVLIPKLGVVVVEVKSHLKVSVKEGVWHLGSESVAHESPFVQAERAMFSIRRGLLQKLSFARGVTFLNVCWFTEIDFPKSESFEWHNWQVLNSEDLGSPATALVRSFNLGLEHLNNTVSRRVDVNPNFGEPQIHELVEYLRPDFDYMLSEKLIRSRRKMEMIHFVQDQYAALDLFALISRVIFNGPAGTGKSLLAVEFARRASLDGKKVRLICFNTLLASFLRTQIQNPNLEITTIDSLALRIAGLASRNELAHNPIEALKALSLEDILVPEEYKSDLLVLDEAQDTLNTTYLTFLNSVLKGGMTSGSWVAFGDFEAQRIYWNEDNVELVRNRFGEVPVARLGKNCRNVVQIGHFAEAVLPTLPKWAGFLRSDQNPDPQLIPILPNVDMIPLLDGLISSFRKEYFSFDEIVILSPLELPNPSELFSESAFAEKFVDIDHRRTGRIAFSTIARYKGLESSCVIALDLEQLSEWKTRSEFLYILFTRATDRLAIVANDQARSMLVASLGQPR